MGSYLPLSRQMTPAAIAFLKTMLEGFGRLGTGSPKGKERFAKLSVKGFAAMGRLTVCQRGEPMVSPKTAQVTSGSGETISIAGNLAQKPRRIWTESKVVRYKMSQWITPAMCGQRSMMWVHS